MNQKIREEIFESIMKKITPIIERCIAEYEYDDSVMFMHNIMLLDNELEKIKDDVNKKLSQIPPEEVDSLCLDCAANARILRTMLP